MPNAFIKKEAKKHHTSTEKLESIYKKVEKSAEKSGATNPYAVATSAVEKYLHKNNK